jgi:hypothetical protein
MKMEKERGRGVTPDGTPHVAGSPAYENGTQNNQGYSAGCYIPHARILAHRRLKQGNQEI